MAAANSQDNCSLDQSIPQWKRELILRRRALSRTLPAGNTSVKLTCPSVVTAVKQADQVAGVEDIIGKQQRCGSSAVASSKALLDQAQADFHPNERGGNSSLAFSDSAVVVSNMRLLEHRVDPGSDLINGISMDNTNTSTDTRCVKYNDRMSEEKSSKSCFSRAVLDNSAVMSENNNCCRSLDDGTDSDSSEELQYGPGIVNKLKDKYMSMTLRESQGRTTRTSLHMRRAASLENIVDSDDMGSGGQQHKAKQKFNKRTDVTSKLSQAQSSSQHQRYRGINRGNDSLKRARSVETLLRYDSRSSGATGNLFKSESPNFGQLKKSGSRDVKLQSAHIGKSLCKDDIVIVENKSKIEPSPPVTEELQHSPKVISPPKVRTPSVTMETELPPPDLVKQTLRIFEKRPNSGKLGSNVNSKSAINNLSKIATSSNSSGSFGVGINKPVLSPKPSPEKIRQNMTGKPGSPRKNASADQQSFSFIPSNKPNFSEIHTSPPTSPIGFKCSLDRLKSPSPTSEINKQLVVSVSRDSDADSPLMSPVNPSLNIINGRVEGATVSLDSTDSLDGSVKVVSHSALENIRKCGVSEVYHFIPHGSAGQEKPKTYLPGTQIVPSPKIKAPSPVPQKSDQSVLHKIVSSSSSSSTKTPSSPQAQMKQVGVIKPMVTSKISSNLSPLTTRERENNVKNREKSIDQGIIQINRVAEAGSNRSEIDKCQVEGSASETVFPSRILRETKVPGLWDKKQPSNELTYNFVNSKSSIPDYIPNDGLIISKKPVKPKPGESGYIRLSGSDDSSMDVDVDLEFMEEGPPSPCNLEVVGGNVLINGRSSMRKDNRQRNLHICFNDSATTTFEYPSEASLIDEMIPPAPGVPAPPGGSSLASYTPSKVVLASEGFQLGVTRSTPPSTSQSKTSPDHLPKEEPMELEQHLKPAEDGETMAWSEGNTSDLLF